MSLSEFAELTKDPDINKWPTWIVVSPDADWQDDFHYFHTKEEAMEAKSEMDYVSHVKWS